MSEIREYEYPYQSDNSEMITAILNATESAPDSYYATSENCHITKGIESSRAVQKFINWIQETTNTKLETVWGVWYRDGGGIQWHAHNGEDIKYSFVYYIQVPESSSSLHFSKDPETEEATILPINQGVCVVWDRGLPHCVPPSNHLGRCVISGNLK